MRNDYILSGIVAGALVIILNRSHECMKNEEL